MGGSLLAMEWALVAFLRVHRMGSRLDKWARGDPKWEKHEGAGGPITGGVVNTWDMIGYPQEVRKENERVLGYVPYENITRLTDNIYSCGKENLQNKIDKYKHTIKGYKKEYKILAKGYAKGGNFEEFEKYVEDSERWIKEAKEELKWIKWALEKLEFIKELEDFDDNTEIYVGVEVGNPTVDDIV